MQGVAAGGGCAIALTCDLRVATPESQLRHPDRAHARQLPLGGELRRLVDLVGPARVKDLLFTGRLIDAAEAAALGLVTPRRSTASDSTRPFATGDDRSPPTRR